MLTHPQDKDKYISLERLRWSAAFAIPIATEMPPDFPALTLPTMRALAVLYEEAGADDQTKLVAALDALYTATWVERRATHKGDVLRGVLGGVFGEGEAERGMALFYFLIFSWGHHRSPSALMWCILSPPSPPSTHPYIPSTTTHPLENQKLTPPPPSTVLQASTTTAGKALLLKLTDAAFDAGAFGLPWMVCTNPKTGATEGFWGVDHLGQVAQFLGLPVPKTAGDKAGWKALL